MIHLRIAHVLSSLHASAAASQALNLAGWFKGEGHETVLVSAGGEREADAESSGVPLLRFKPGGAAWLFRGRRRLLREVGRWRPDLLHVHRPGDLDLACAMVDRCLVPLVVTVHGQPGEDWIERLQDRRISMILVPSESHRAHLIGRLGLERDKVAILPYGFQLDRFAESGSGQISRLVTMGHFGADRVAFEQVADCIARLRTDGLELRGRFVGSGAGRQAMERQLRSRELDKFITVEQAPARTAPILADSDAMLYAVERDSHPIAVLKAMASGRPVIASAVGSVTELIQDGVSGLLIPPRDSDALAGAVQRLVDAPEAAWEMGRAARRFIAEQHDLQEVGSLAHELYRTTLRGRDRTGTETVKAYRRFATGS